MIGSGLVSLSTLALPFEQTGDATKIAGSGPFGALLAGQAHVVRQVQAYDEKQVEDRRFVVLAAPTRGLNNSIAFHPDNPLVADVRVRRALLHATDAAEIVDTLYSRNYPVATSVLAATGNRGPARDARPRHGGRPGRPRGGVAERPRAGAGPGRAGADRACVRLHAPADRRHAEPRRPAHPHPWPRDRRRDRGGRLGARVRVRLGIDRPTSCRIEVDGVEATLLRGEALRLHRRRIQLVYQNPFSSLDPRMTVEAIVAEPLRNFAIASRAEAAQRVRAILDRVGLGETLWTRGPGALPGGQRQRVAIARALILEPAVLVLDEAVSASRTCS